MDVSIFAKSCDFLGKFVLILFMLICNSYSIIIQILQASVEQFEVRHLKK